MFNFRLQNCYSAGVLVDDVDVDRLSAKIDNVATLRPFIVFNGTFKGSRRRIALNRKQLVWAQFDPVLNLEVTFAAGGGEAADCLFCGSCDVLSFPITRGEAGQLARLFAEFESFEGHRDRLERLTNASGAKLWLRLDEVALFSTAMDSAEPGISD